MEIGENRLQTVDLIGRRVWRWQDADSIVKALLNLKKIARGDSVNGLKWEIDFSTRAGHDYKWSGAFENKGFVSEIFSNFINRAEDEQDKPLIENEQLFIDQQLIIARDKDGILFNDHKTVKLSPQESVIALLKIEEQIKDVYDNFKKMLHEDNRGNDAWPGFDLIELQSLLKRYKNLNDIRNSPEHLKTKLFLLSKNINPAFREIVWAFTDIFPYIEDVRIEGFNGDYQGNPELHRVWLIIEIKEKNVSHWIGESKISSGMWKTLLHLAELYLCADNTVILIDEFENSLGINCINQITRSILDSERNLQFIITSHHPYIINDIGLEHWKIVTRKGSTVTATDAEKLGIGRSKHQAFTQLANLTAYSEGIDS